MGLWREAFSAGGESVELGMWSWILERKIIADNEKRNPDACKCFKL